MVHHFFLLLQHEIALLELLLLLEQVLLRIIGIYYRVFVNSEGLRGHHIHRRARARRDPLGSPPARDALIREGPHWVVRSSHGGPNRAAVLIDLLNFLRI